MTKIIITVVVSVVLGAVCARVPSRQKGEGKPKAVISTVDGAHNFHSKHILFDLEPQDIQYQNNFLSCSTPYELLYRFGRRRRGDELYVDSTIGIQHDLPWDAKVGFIARPNPKFKITYVELVIKQDTDSGSACISEGGIGQNSIQVDVVVKDTICCSLTRRFYGYLTPNVTTTTAIDEVTTNPDTFT